MAENRYQDLLNFVSLWDKPRTQDYKKSLRSDVTMRTGSWQDTLNYLMPIINKAVKRAEGDPKRYGVRSRKVGSSEEANQVLNESIRNNFFRWLQSGKPKPFVSYMRDRWAPLNAPNDPKRLNYNWVPNVNKSIQQQLGKDKYSEWEQSGLVGNNNIDKLLMDLTKKR